MVEQQVAQLVGDPLTERQIDPARVVDVEAKTVRSRVLERDQLDARIELRKSLLYLGLKVVHLSFCLLRAEKKVGQAHSSTRCWTWKSLEPV
jgi:hypothetical protein